MNHCSIPSCSKPARSKGLCNAHYERMRLNGHPLASGRGNSKRSSVTILCEVCSSPFHPWKGREKTSRTCSRKCNGAISRLMNSNSEADFDSYFAKEGRCWEWKGPMRWNGYGIFSLRGASLLAHRYSYERSKGNIPEGLFVCHTCDNPPCVNPDHLWLGTHAENLEDMRVKGRAHKGPSVHSEAHPLSKITRDIARAIRADPRPAHEIAPEYAVSKSLVRGIKKGTHWKYA